MPSAARAMRHAGAVLLLGLLLGPASLRAQGSSYEQLQTFSSLLNQIRISYVDSVNYSQLVHAAIDGVLSSLDPHSRFLSRADADRESAYDAGQLAGSGLLLDEVNGELVVLSTYPQGPADRAGVAAGDRLLSVNDTSAAGLSPSEVSRALLGEKGHKVKLKLLRGSRLEPDTVRATLKFDFLQPHSVGITGMLDGTTGYVRFQQFFLKGGDDLERAIKDLKKSGAKRVIVDLRGDPGGVVIAAVDVAGLFLPRKTVIYRTDGRRSSSRDTVSTSTDGPFRDLPLMMLIDNGSASASELVASSLQDHDRALLLGRRSFGKALIQAAFPIPPQGDLVWLTVARIYTPSGRIIQRSYRGIKAEQYYSFAGRTGTEQDTAEVFHTDAGRAVRGGGGIAPDIVLPKTPDFPAWWSVAADSGWIEAISDSVASLLSKDPKELLRWQTAADEWQTRLVAPFLQRARDRLHVAIPPDTALESRIGRNLAYRAAEVRWGRDAAEQMVLRNDPDIQAAMGYWDRLPELLARGH